LGYITLGLFSAVKPGDVATCRLRTDVHMLLCDSNSLGAIYLILVSSYFTHKQYCLIILVCLFSVRFLKYIRIAFYSASF